MTATDHPQTDQPLSGRRVVADHLLTSEGSQEMLPRSMEGGVEVLRELGSVLRMSEAEAASPRADRSRHHRDDDHQHGPAASEHPRRAAADARARRRDGAAHQADRRVPPHRHGEDRRGAHLPAGAHQRHPHGLCVTAVQRAGVRAGHRAATRCRDPPTRAVDPHARHRGQPRGLEPVVHGDQRHGPRGGVDDDLRMAGARGDAPVPRTGHRAADEPQLHPSRWRRRRPPRRLARRPRPPPRLHPAAARAVRHADEQPAHLARAVAGGRRAHHRGSHRPRCHRADPALHRLRLGPAADDAVPLLRPGRLRRHRRAPTATATTATPSGSTRSASRSGSSARSSRRCPPATTGCRTRRSRRHRGPGSTSRWKR